MYTIYVLYLPAIDLLHQYIWYVKALVIVPGCYESPQAVWLECLDIETAIPQSPVRLALGYHSRSHSLINKHKGEQHARIIT